LVTNDTRKCNYRNTGSASANINDHVPDWFLYINPDTQSSSHWLMNQIHFFGACLLSAITNGPFFHLGN
jgi:hypothetical protein